MTYTLGAIKNIKDLRDIQLVQVQAPVTVPVKHITDISWMPVLNQRSLGACVGHAHALIHIYNEYKENGKIEKLSPRFIYALAKKIDGMASEGTQPRIAAKVQKDKGCPDEKYCINNTTLSHSEYINVYETGAMLGDAKRYGVKGFTNVLPDKESLKQAIFQNGLVAITISVGNYNNPILPGTIGLHRVTLFGYDGDRFFYRNSWGEEWGDTGNGYFDWGTQQLYDGMVFTDIPNSILEEIKKKYQYFSEKEVIGLKPELVLLLDKARGIAGVPFKITSGLRSVEKNKEVGGKEKSAHLTGEAVDIACSDAILRWKIFTALLQVGFNRLEVAKSHIHADISKTLPQNIIDFSNLA